jgi:hypothetical protein
MKKIILFALAIFAGAGALSAQGKFEKGAFALQAQTSGLNVTNVSYGDYSSTNLSLQLSPMYFIFDKLALKADLGVTGVKYDDSDLELVYNGGIGARFYIMGGLFAGATIEAVKSGDADPYGAGKAEAGFSIFLNDKVFIEPSVYLRKQLDFESWEFADSNEIGLQIGFGFVF